MKETRCMICGKVWVPKEWQDFLTFCGTCTKEWNVYFEKLVNRQPKRLKALRVEDDGA